MNNVTENRKKWIAALRSGKYQQDRGFLKTEENGFCCLGVACDISELHKWHNNGYNGEIYEPPTKVREMFGLSEFGNLSVNILASMNDKGGTFSKIADYIEEITKEMENEQA